MWPLVLDFITKYFGDDEAQELKTRFDLDGVIGDIEVRVVKVLFW